MGRVTPLGAGSAAQQAAAARLEFGETAGQLASHIGGKLAPFDPDRALTALAEWFVDEVAHQLVVIVGAHEGVAAIDDVLAYALAWQEDRELLLVVPETHAEPALARLPWISTAVRVLTYGTELEPKSVDAPTRAAVLAAAKTRPLRTTAQHELGDRGAWVEALTGSADAHWALVPAHRPTYRAWHCRGRQVLRVARTRKGLRIKAGVQYGKPPPGKEPLREDVTGPLTPIQRAKIEATVAVAVADRIGGDDKGHVEHRMQAALAATELRGLGLTQFAREYPAWRAENQPGFIDFLGIDRHNHLHVVETKVGTADVDAVLQALDYAVWVSAHAGEIRAERGWAEPTDEDQVVVDLVLAPKGSGGAVGPYLEAQLKALCADVDWRVTVVSNPLADVPKLLGPVRRSMPELP